MIDELAEIILGEELVVAVTLPAIDDLPFDEAAEAHVRGLHKPCASEEWDDPRGFMEDEI